MLFISIFYIISYFIINYTLNNYAWIVTSTSSNSSPSLNNTSATANSVETSSDIFTWIGITSAIWATIMTLSSPQSMWNVVNQFQTLELLYLTHAYFPEETTSGFSILSKYINFSFDFIPYQKLSFISIIYNFFNLPVDGDLMSKVGLKSGSTFLNNFSLLINYLFVVLIHLTFLAICRILNTRWSIKPWAKFVINKVYKLFTLCLYIRLMMEAYQFLLIWSTDEIYSFKASTNSEITSLAIAILAFIVWNIFAIFVFFLTIKQIYYKCFY